jgi:prepilin-type N-terminal cleavage/methylation domain-containing protein
MNNTELKTQRGFSLIELMIVLLIISILVVFAVAQFGEASTVFETQNVARELKVNLERARFDSVKRRPDAAADMASVVINNDTSISVSIDRNQDGVLQSTETKTIDFSGRNNVKIVGDGVAYPVTIRFDRRGHVSTTNALGLEISPLFIICDECTTFADADNPTSYYIKLSPTGTVSMYDNGQTPPSISDPTVTSVNSNRSIEPMVSTAPGALDLTGITGMPTPIPDPSPTPTPSPSPSATPTPASCSVNERPAVTGCVCLSPLSVGADGRCR